MKKLFAIFSLLGILTFGVTSVALAQQDSTAQAPATATEQVVEEATTAEVETGSFHNSLKVKFIEGSAFFMSFVALSLIFGLAFCIERLIYLNLAQINSKKLLEQIEALVKANKVDEAKTLCQGTRGPIASICFQGLSRLDQGVDIVEKSVVSYGGVQSGLLEKNLSWITLFIALAPSLGFLGTVIGMIQAFDKIQQVGDISPTVVAGGMKVALITTVGGLIVALILQVIYNYILAKYEAILNDMEDSSVSFMDIVVAYEVKK